TVMNAPAGITAIEYDCKGANITLNNGASSAIDAVVYAADLVASGAAEIVFAGGFESSRRDLDPGHPPVSFACVLAVTTLANAQAAGAQPSAQLVGFGSSNLPDSRGGEARREILNKFLEAAVPAVEPQAREIKQPPPCLEAGSAEQSLIALLSAVQRLRKEGSDPWLAIWSGAAQETFSGTLLLSSSH
ncbi:MAG TPA: beta-ketoacyl synthase N-terminal-like domain-containing protein, partial [Thermoanaerobaculia bacterium]|nr:beta-ketoacyl synthase N-terminal-like domain-containing protein [Thermoanaerobaculia bacterium]